MRRHRLGIIESRKREFRQGNWGCSLATRAKWGVLGARLRRHRAFGRASGKGECRYRVRRGAGGEFYEETWTNRLGWRTFCTVNVLGKVCTDITELSFNEGTANTKKRSLRQLTCRQNIHMYCSPIRGHTPIVSSALNSLELPDHLRSIRSRSRRRFRQ